MGKCEECGSTNTKRGKGNILLCLDCGHATEP